MVFLGAPKLVAPWRLLGGFWIPESESPPPPEHPWQLKIEKKIGDNRKMGGQLGEMEENEGQMEENWAGGMGKCGEKGASGASS